MSSSRAFMEDVRGLLVTVSLAFVGGWLCEQLSLPAPYLLGSLMGVWVAGLAVKGIRGHLGIPRWVHVPMVLGLGVMIGAMFTPSMLTSASHWIGSIVTLLVATLAATAAGYWYLTRMRGYDPKVATMCSLPGGQVELVILSRELVENSHVVALCHLVRVAAVFLATPLILSLVEGRAGVQHSREVMDHLPGLIDLSMSAVLAFAALGLCGYLIGKWIRLPMPHLLGPLLLSAFAHLTGVVELPRISEFILMAQLIIGGAVGAHLSRAPIAQLPGYLRDGLVNACLIISVYTSCALVFSFFSDIHFLNLFLAFIPGGLYEVTLLTLLFGFDVAFVAVHHTVRVLIIFSTIPALVAWFARDARKIDEGDTKD
jgi:uncharacterized protein